MGNFNTIGDYLKSHRLNAKLSILDLAEKTKINKNVLEYLEESNFKKLPSKTYVRGFVINYAKALSLNTKEALEILENHYPKTETKTSEAEQIKPKEEVSPALKEFVWFSHTLFKKEILFGLVGIVIVIFIVNKFISINEEIQNGQESESEKITEPVKNEQLTPEFAAQDIKSQEGSLFDLESTKKLREEIKDDASNVDKKSPTTIVEVKTEIKAEPVVVAPQVIKEPTPIIEAKPTPVEVKKELPKTNAKLYPYVEFKKANIKYNFNESAKELNDTNVLPSNIKAAMVTGRENVFINSYTGDTWLTYKVDNEKIKRFVLRQGRTLFLKGKKIVLFLGTRDTAKVFYNKKLVDISSDSGSRSLVFPPEQASNHLLPLFQTGKDGVSYTAEDYQQIMGTVSP
jgi:cytoskeleton protein RodZ